MNGSIEGLIREVRKPSRNAPNFSLIRIGIVESVTGDVVNVTVAGALVENVSYLVPLTAVEGDRVALVECDGDLILLSKVTRGTL